METRRDKGECEEELDSSSSPLPIEETATIERSDQKRTKVDVDITDGTVAVGTRKAAKTFFNLSSIEGQEHLRELNEELKALNEDGSPMLSVLHGPSSTDVTTTESKSKHKKKSRKRKRPLETTQDIDEEDGDDGAGPSTSKSGGGHTGPKRLFHTKRKHGSDKDKIPDIAADEEIDTILDEKAWRNNLTTVNVKSILRYVITNEHVLSMVRKRMNEDSGEVSAVYEPKLTRSKAKELMEKREKVPWPISPIKGSSSTKTKPLIELDFSESSSDEEYRPEKELESEAEESFLSQTSEVDSPQKTHIEVQSIVESSPIKDDEKMHTDEQNEDTIALRTRSKLPLNDTPLESIESNFIAPDITTDMYDSECDDNEDWGNFLGEFLKPLDPDPSAVGDDDANDPEYNFLEEEDIPDREDLRDDRAVKISKKEIQELLYELFEAAEDELNEVEDEDRGGAEQPSPPETSGTRDESSSDLLEKSDATNTACEEPLFDDGRKQQLDEQMRQHVQLLTQVFLLTAKTDVFSQDNETCRTLMLELKRLAANSQLVYGRCSAFSAHNLQEAHQIVTSYDDKSNEETKTSPPSASYRRKVPTVVAHLMAYSQVFIYPELLPIAGFCRPKNTKDTFTESEDVLLALGLEQFEPLVSKKKLHTVWKDIKENMLPVKTTKQLCIRSKNLRSTNSQPNPVKYLYQFKKTQPITHSIKHFDANCVRPPAEKQIKNLPQWLQKYIRRDKLSTGCLLPLLPSSVTKVQQEIYKNVPKTQTFIPPATLISTTRAPSLETAVVLSSASSSRPIPSPAVLGPTVVVPFNRTLEKTGSTFSVNTPMFVGSHLTAVPRVSPLKQVSPILKKYRPICLRKTGGNLKKALPKLHPKLVIVNSSHDGFRKLAPKPLTISEATTSVVQIEEKPPESPILKDDDKKDDDCEELSGEENSPNDKEVAEGPMEALSDLDSEVEIFDDGDDTADDEGIDMQADNEDDLAALMTASTTMKTPKHRRHIICKQKKQLLRKEMLGLIAQDSDPLVKEERENAFASAYLQKAKEAIGEDTQLFEDFLKVLYDFNQNDGNVVQLYKDVCYLLKDFPQVCEEFVAFLLPEQAMECGKYMEHLSLSKMQMFLRKLEVHFGKHPQHLQKILKMFTHFQQQENVTLSELRETMLPLFRGRTHLIDEFLQLFPEASPPESSMVDFEEVSIPNGNEEIDVDEDRYEVVELPEADDLYGTKDCTCECHLLSDKPKVQTRLKHCLRCGIKFIDGRIFLQTGKVLKPCRVVYHHHRQKGHQIETSDKHNSHLEPDDPMVPSPSSSLSSLSIPIFNHSDEEHDVSEPETQICSKEEDEEVVNKQNDRPANPFREALNQISQEDGTRFNLPSASIEDAILTSDVSASTSSFPADFSLIRNVICHKKPSPGFKARQLQLDSDTTRQSSAETNTTSEEHTDSLLEVQPVADSQSSIDHSFANTKAIDESGKDEVEPA